MKRIIAVLTLVVCVFSCTRIETLTWGEKHVKAIYSSAFHAAFPCAVQLKSGESLVVFREGSGHVSPDGRILLLRSGDGKSWSRPDTIISTAWDSRDPSIMQLKDGAILVNFFQSTYDDEGRLEGAVGCFVVRSFDNGITFTAPRMAALEGYDWAATSDAILERADGTLLMPVYGGRPGEKSASFIAFSHDLGETWPETALIAQDAEGSIGFQEPALLLLPDGRILCHMRTAGAGRFLYQSVSADGGKTWTDAVRTNIRGEAPDLFLTNEGTLLCAYRDYWPKGVGMMRSYDFGETWEGEVQLGAATGDCAYPSIISLKNHLLAVYYVYDESTGPAGRHSAIMGSYFNVSQPGTPLGFSASLSGDVVDLRWNLVKGAAYYLVYRDSVDSFQAIPGYPHAGNAIASPTATYYRDDLQRSGQTWHYRISAVAGTGALIEGTGSESLPTEPLTVTAGKRSADN